MFRIKDNAVSYDKLLAKLLSLRLPFIFSFFFYSLSYEVLCYISCVFRRSSSVQFVDNVSPATSHENGLDDAGSDDTASEEYSNNNSVTQNGKKKLERTSNNLSKLADKLNTGRSKQNGEPGGKQAQPAFRRRGSSNIAKLNTGNSKERTGTSQIHGQTPYMKSPKFDTKQPAGKRIPNSGMIAQRGLPRFTGGPNAKGGASSRVEDDKAAPGANETFEIPSADGAGMASVYNPSFCHF